MAGIPSQHLWSFFNPAEPAPAFAAAPADAAAKDRILLLAKYAMQNGISFVDMVRTNQGEYSRRCWQRASRAVAAVLSLHLLLFLPLAGVLLPGMHAAAFCSSASMHSCYHLRRLFSTHKGFW